MRGLGAGQVQEMAFQDFPLRAISILAIVHSQALESQALLSTQSNVSEHYSRLEGVLQILGDWDCVCIGVSWWLSFTECLLNVRHGAKHSTCISAFNP